MRTRARETTTAISWATFILLWGSTAGYIGPDGVCQLNVFAPFTNRTGGPHQSLFERNFTVGFSYMAAAALAVEHFNSRNESMVPALANLTNCTVQLNISKVFDSRGYSDEAGRQFWEFTTSGSVQPSTDVCAIAGPSFDQPTADLGVMANANNIPLVSTYTEKIISDIGNTVITTIFPDLMENALVVATYLIYKGRDDFVAFLHPLSDKGLQEKAALGVFLDNKGVRWMSSSFVESKDGSVTTNGTESLVSRTIWEAVRRIRERGYRTVVVSVEFPEWSVQLIADALNFFGMNRGEYLYVFFDPDIMFQRQLTFSNNENLTRMFNGASLVLPMSRDLSITSDGPMNASGWAQLASFVENLTALNPLDESDPAYTQAESSIFDPANYGSSGPQYGSAFAYDAVMAIGIGACESKKQSDGSVDGIDHHHAIRRSSFLGASGLVKFGRDALLRGGTRLGYTLDWYSVNFFNQNLSLPDVLYTGIFSSLMIDVGSAEFDDIVDAWLPTGLPFTYADGTSDPPYPLRDPGEQNYLSQGLRVTGLVLMSLTMFLSVLVGLWVYLCREHRVLAASQPKFLYVICGGIIVESSAIATISFDESYGVDRDQLSALCMALPWLLSTGVIVVISALFTKLLRVHRTLQFSRRKVKLTQIAWPMALLVSAALLILTLWTLLDPLEWKREFIDDNTAESVGSCRDVSGNLAAYLVPLFIVVLAALCLMAFMAYKTRDIDEAYSESTWILILIIVQVEVCIVASPVVIQMHNEDPNINYIVSIMVLLSFPWTTLGLIFLPKVIAYTKAVRGIEPRHKRGQHSGNTRVTGIDFSNFETSNQAPTSTAPSTPEQYGGGHLKEEASNQHRGRASVAQTIPEGSSFQTIPEGSSFEEGA